MPPKATIILELLIAALILILTAFRIHIHRISTARRVRRGQPAYIAYEVCLWLALGANMYITGLDVWGNWREMSMEKELAKMTVKEVNRKMMTGRWMKFFFAGGICYTHFLWLVKGSFIAIYFDISEHFTRRVRLTLYCVTAFTITTYIINILLKFLWCLPFERNWSLGPDRCTFAIALPVNSCTTFFNIATDLALLTFFILVMSSLHLRHRSELIAAGFIFLIGTFTIVAAAVRYGVAYIAFKDSDCGWRNAKRLLLWTNIEMGLVMVAVTLPAFRVIFRAGAKGRSGPSGDRSQEETRIPIDDGREGGSEVRLRDWEIRHPAKAVERGKDGQVKLGFRWEDEFRDYESDEEVEADGGEKRSSVVKLWPDGEEEAAAREGKGKSVLRR